MRASSTRALSNHVYQSSSSCRKLAPVASDTFLVASLHSRSMKPGMFSRVTVGKERFASSQFTQPFLAIAQNTLCGLFELCIVKAAYPGWPPPVMGWHCVSAEHFLPTECACRHFQHQALRWWRTGCGRSWPAVVGQSFGPDLTGWGCPLSGSSP